MIRPFLTIALLLLSLASIAQDDLLQELESNQTDETTYTIQTFYGTRLVNGHSMETKAKGGLEFIISHRFGALNRGSYDLWGFDFSTIRLGLEYGVTDQLGIGLGRSSWDKNYDGYVKYKFARQSSGAKSFPVTMTLLGTMGYLGVRSTATSTFSSGDRLSYAAQLLIARKLSSSVSLQLAPIYLHQNRIHQPTPTTTDLFAVGMGGRVKITRSVGMSLEYFARTNEKEANAYFNALGISVDIETGGHVFQLIFTNTRGMMERRILTETTGDFFDGDIHFGFNITRTFQPLHKK